MNVRQGGVWRFCMHGPDGRDYENQITYLEVSRPRRLVYKHGGDQDVEPVNFQVTVDFEDAGGKTRLTMRMQFPSAAARDHVVKTYGAVEGGRQTLERLAAHVAEASAKGHGRVAPGTSREFVITRVLASPRDLVYRAWTERDRLVHWFGPKGCTIPACTLDLRPGGVFHYCMRFPNGTDWWGRWVFREIVPKERLVFVSSFADEAGNAVRAPFSADWPVEMHSTVRFADHAGIGGGTVVTVRVVAMNATDAECKKFEEGFESMKQGWTDTFEQLAEYLAKA